MAQPNPIPQSNARSQAAINQPDAKQSPQQHPPAIPQRSPSLQAEIERIRVSETYKDVARDQQLFNWLTLDLLLYKVN